MRIGLTGGIGSGKSEVAKFFESCGAYVIDTDRLAREAVAPNSDALREIAREWPSVVREGALDRAALAQIVFSDTVARERLNAIVHPHVRRLALEREARALPGQPVVHVVPLLFETGYDRLVDATVVVAAPEVERIERVLRRDGIGEEQTRARMAAQLSPDDARSRATIVIENDGDLRTLRTAAKAAYERLVRESTGVTAPLPGSCTLPS